MDLQQYVMSLQEQLQTASAAGGEPARELAGRLTAPLETATRLVLLEALSAAASEITRELAPGSVDVRLRGRDPEFVVTPPPASTDFDGAADSLAVTLPPTQDSDEGPAARFTLRLPEPLKLRIEEAAAKDKVSVNAWLVRSVTASLDGAGKAPGEARRTPSGGHSFTGWVR
ncbi:MAG TPA: toxin-antitoxin system HicB family antitoxin [Arthrobacter sp.]